MDIVKSNFNERLEDIAEAIDTASFLTIDAEFTGLEKEGYNHSSAFDTPFERYLRLREGSLDFLIIQFGLCAFKFKEETQSYEARPFNFYVFPRPLSQRAPDRRFLCQSSSIDFLVQQGFDFNKLFREGIPYLTSSQEEVMRASLITKHNSTSNFIPGMEAQKSKGTTEIPDDQKSFIKDVCDKVSSFIQDSGETNFLHLDPCSSFQRKLIYETIQSKFSSSVHLETKTGDKKERFIVVTKVTSEEDLKKKEKDKQNAEIMELGEAVGFSNVIQLIINSGKIVVGHNMLLDLMLTLNQFCYPLPDTLNEFKAMVKCYLPRLLDTKHMASVHPLKDYIPYTSLANLEQTLKKAPFTPAKVELAEEFKSYENATERYHEAGYDAFITGCMFATMTDFVGKRQDSTKPVMEPSVDLLEPFMNKLFLMRVPDIPYMNLDGLDLTPSRDHVFHVTFPKEWKASDIFTLFALFGNIYIGWLNETSAFVSLHKKDRADLVLKTLNEKDAVYKVVPYKVHMSTIPETAAETETPLSKPDQSPSHQSKPTLKRLAAASEDNGNLPHKARKLCKSDTVGATAAVLADDEVPEIVPRSQADNKSSDNGSVSSGMFEVPSDW